MKISFRTDIFDTERSLPDDAFYGEDLAKWLAERLTGWSVGVVPEDWGWAVTGRKSEYAYIFGVYDHDTNDKTDQGALWVLRLYNQKDKTSRFKKLFKYVPPVAHEEVVTEVASILTGSAGIADVSIEPLR